MTLAPVLVFGIGNPSRGDDRVGHAVLQHLTLLSPQKSWPVELLTDFQLQIEHILDIQHRQLVLFVDASISCQAPFQLQPVQPLRDFSFSSHAMTPAALLHGYQMQIKTSPPATFLLAIKAEHFELGQPICATTLNNLHKALAFCEHLLDTPELAAWQELAHNARNFAA